VLSVDFRVEELAEAAGISVELLRSYQSRGLVPPPRHEGRVALYGARHLDRLKLIRRLRDEGYSLKMVATALSEERPPADSGDAVESPEELLTHRDVAERTGVHPAMLRSLEGSGVLRPRRFDGELRYTDADVRAVRMLLTLLGYGLPLEEFLEVAKVQIAANDAVAAAAVDLFLRNVREPLLAADLSHKAEAERLVAALRLMLHGATALVGYHFQRAVLNGVQEELERTGSRAERAALRRELRRRGLEAVAPL
jgi:DNA-binding transcriptional MerR regulator